MCAIRLGHSPTLQRQRLDIAKADEKSKEVRAAWLPQVSGSAALIFGMMPIAFAHGAGAEWKSGLASSMVLTLVVVPSVYLIVDMMKGEMKFR